MHWLGPILWLRDLLTGPHRIDYEQRGDTAVKASRDAARPTGPGELRRASFERGDRPLPAASWPPPRRTGWEDDLRL